MKDGFILLNKPKGIASRKALDIVLEYFKSKGGNEGTLDPFAEGLLLIGLNLATRFMQYFKPLTKEYIATLKLGGETDTLDVSGEIVATAEVPEISDKCLLSALDNFIGTIEQMPPKFSAQYVNGKRAYKLARKGKEFELKSRKVMIKKIEILDKKNDEIIFKTEVSSGTYIRSLARDLALALGTKGYLKELTRTRIGDLDIKQSITLDDMKNDMDNRKFIVPAHKTMYWIPEIILGQNDLKYFKNGRKIESSNEQGLYKIFSDRIFIGLGRVENNILMPERLLPTD